MYEFNPFWLKIQKVPFLKCWGSVLEPKFFKNLAKLGLSGQKNTHQPHALAPFYKTFNILSL